MSSIRITSSRTGPTTVAIDFDDYPDLDRTSALTASAMNIIETIRGDMIDDAADDTPGLTEFPPLLASETPDYQGALIHPGDAVRITWPDGSSRLFINTGTSYYSPSTSSEDDHAGFPEPLRILPGDLPTGARVHPVARLGNSLGGDF